MDIIIKAAAVADYRPVHVAEEKVKKIKTVHFLWNWNGQMIF